VGLEACGQHFRDTFNRGVLQSNRPEVLRTSGMLLLREEDQKGAVDSREISAVIVESGEQV
jgi:hypothetical protein